MPCEVRRESKDTFLWKLDPFDRDRTSRLRDFRASALDEDARCFEPADDCSFARETTAACVACLRCSLPWRRCRASQDKADCLTRTSWRLSVRNSLH